jgi:hypothetical protein
MSSHPGFFIFVNSRDSDFGTSARFTIDFQSSGIPFSESEISIALDYAIFPNLVYPIRSGRNKFVFNEGGADIIVTIPDGNYNSTNFTTTLKTLMDAASTAGRTYTVSISSTTNKLTITGSAGTFSLEFANSQTSEDMWKIMGFNYKVDTSAALAQTGQMPVRLDGDEYYALTLENIGNDNMSSSFNIRGLMDLIPMSGNFGDVIYYKPNEVNNLNLGQLSQLKLMQIRICDKDGYDIPIADNCEVTLKFRVIQTHLLSQ